MERVPQPDQRDVYATENPIPVEQHFPSSSVEVNMEVSITADEVMRAGGFGATDDIGTMLPAASDCTDFEDHLRDVRGYEGSKDKFSEGQFDSPDLDLGAGKADIKVIDQVEEGIIPEAQYGCAAVDMGISFFSVASDYTLRKISAMLEIMKNPKKKVAGLALDGKRKPVGLALAGGANDLLFECKQSILLLLLLES